MASHEAAEVPHTHHEESEDVDDVMTTTPESSSRPSIPSAISQSRKVHTPISKLKHIEHDAEDAVEEAIEASTGQMLRSRRSSDTSNPQTLNGERGEQESSKDHVTQGADQDLEAQDGQIAEPGKGKKKKEIELQDQTNLLPVKQIIIVFAGLSAALFCSLLDQTIVSTALPELGRVFQRADIVSWVGTAYLLTSTAFQPIYSRLSDIFGRKVVLLVSLAIFWIGSLACALARSMIQLIVFRALAGVGGGGILTMVMVCVSDVVSLKDRGKYQGILGGVVALSNSLGPVLGGVFVDKASWRWCFWINLPMIAIGMFVCVFALPLKSVKGDIRSKLKKIDYGGSVLTLAWAVLILLPLSWGGTQYAWDSAAVIAPLIIGIALLVFFMLYEWKIAVLPLIPMLIFRDVTVAGAMIATILSGMVFYVNLYYLPQYFQVVWGASAIRSGVLLLPLILVQTVTSFTSGMIVSKTGDYRINIYLGFAIWTIGQGLLSTIGRDTSLGKLVGYQILSGVGAGQTFQTTLVAIQAAVSRSDMAVATGARNFIRMLADGIRNIYYFMTPCVGVAFFVSVFLIKAHDLRRDDEKALKEAGKQWAEKHSKKGKHEKKHSGQGGELPGHDSETLPESGEKTA
ncbi:hypothetical protein QFC21_004094 [Naganishia friedmannii]|uniref:Uncharacterized protein n=1 Tax=Naganishia friedmannii TaxID=89922 RepID=A0ACC2VJ91_9TREE|nr:hypothetical protein QFC21_004094 [Naganishia friedmannii]